MTNKDRRKAVAHDGGRNLGSSPQESRAENPRDPERDAEVGRARAALSPGGGGE